MKRLLILFANGFPYNTSEPFLENEYPLYSVYFDKVLISTACRRGEEPSRQLDGSFIEVLEDYTLSKDIPSIVRAIPWVLGDKMFYQELKNLWDSGFSLGKLYRLLVFSLCGNHRALQVQRWLKEHPEYDDIVLYSYWLHIPAYGAVRLKQKLGKVRAVSRAHGFDLYSERYTDGYIPFHRQLVEQLDEVASISENGKKYLEAKYGHGEKISVYHLGAKGHEKRGPLCSREPLRIVTCSRTVPLKRLHRVVDALCLMKDTSLEWTHIGGGEAQQTLEQYAKDRLPGNVKALFTGTVPNEQIYEIYGSEPFHLFVNVSETEGIPVAIMEAMSYGIPVVATDVGGTAELVTEGENGYLLDRDYEDAELIELIEKIARMPEAEYEKMRAMAEKSFRDKFNANTNYRRFIEEVLLG